MIDFEETDYGFRYGSATVERVASDDAKGWAYINVKTPKTTVSIYATKTGKVRVYIDGREVTP